MPLRDPPLPPPSLREGWQQPFDDDGFRMAAIEETRWLEVQAGLARDTTVLEIGCGPGRLAIGIGLRLGEIGHYTGVAADPRHVSWCREHLARPGFEFISFSPDHSPDAGSPGEVTLAADRKYDLIFVRTVPWDRPTEVDEMLRMLRHHVADAGTILIVTDPGAPGVEALTDRVHRAGLLITSMEHDRPDAVVELSPGLVGHGKRAFDQLAAAAWQARDSVGLEARLRVLSAEHRQLAESTDAEIDALTAKLRARERLVADLRVRLKQARSENRRLQAAIKVKDLELEAARQTAIDRMFRRLASGVRRSDVEESSAAAPTSPPTTAVAEDTDADEASIRNGHVADGLSRPGGGRPGVDPSRVAIYTALVADHDHLTDVTAYATADARFVCFSDVVPTDARGWEIVPASYFSVDPKRVALFYKTHPHLFFGDRDLSVWVDASISWTRSPFDVLAGVERIGCDTVVLRRDDLLTLEQLADDVCRRGLDSAGLVEDQLGRFRQAGVADVIGLHDTSVLVRRHLADSVIALDEAWWAEIERGSRRDRLSFDVVARSHQVAVGILPASTENETGVVVGRHRSDSRYRRPRSTSEARTHRSAWNLRRESDPAGVRARSELDRIDVVVPVHDALPAVQRCVRSIVEDPAFDGLLILVDDGSRPPTQEWCVAFANTHPDVVLLRNPTPTGFAAASNLGIEATSTDVFVVLNSDVVVPSNWARKMARRLHGDEGIGLIGPLSNAASWQSVPTVRDVDGALAVNGLPPGCSLDDANDYLEALSASMITPYVGTLNGFCLMLRRELIDNCGAFDEVAFPVGYGEEVDLTLRATDAGFLCAVATDTYVYHSKSRSYGHARRAALKAHGQAVLRERYGADRLDRAAASTRNHPALEFVRSAFARLYVPETAAMDSLAARATI